MTSRPTSAEARVFCRGVLPHVSRTFAINIEALDGRMRDAVRVAYLLCRAADALEDSWPGSPPQVIGRFTSFLQALDGAAEAVETLADQAGHEVRRYGCIVPAGAAPDRPSRPELFLVARLPTLLVELESLAAEPGRIIRAAVRTMAEGMSRYASRAAARPAGACYLDDEAELSDYCWVVAGCVGLMLTRLFELRLPESRDPQRETRHGLAPVVGEALQLTNIVLDLPNDLRRGRCYLPAAWLTAAGLEPRDLTTGPWRAESRALVARLEARAHGALDRVADYLDTIPGRHVRYRLFCLLPALWARASLRRVRADPRFPASGRRPKLARSEIWTSAAWSVLVARSSRGVRRLLASG